MFRNSSAASWTNTGPRTNPEVEAFHKSLPHYAVTPLIPLRDLAQELGLGHVLLKDESSRLDLPAFKILGASWAIHKALAARLDLSLDVSMKDLGTAARTHSVKLVTCTEGNWGRAVARMAKYLQITAIVFVPNFMDQATQEKIMGEGAQIVVVDGDYDFSIEKAKEEADLGGMLIMDISWEGYDEIPQWVVEGYTTMLVETDNQLREMNIDAITHAIVSVGVGSWAQAVTLHYKSQADNATIIAVEPDTAASLKASLELGKITPITTGHTIMNGMNCGTTSATAWKVLREGVDVSLTVSDLEVHSDLQYLLSYDIKNGPCGAAPLSALRRLCNSGKAATGLDEKSVVILFSTEGPRDYLIPVAIS